METSYNLEFETRQCSNDGCYKTFKVLTTSKQRVCAMNCAHGPGVMASDFVRRPKDRQPPANLTLIKEKDTMDALGPVPAPAPKPKPVAAPKVEAVKPSSPHEPAVIARDMKQEWESAISEAKLIFKHMSNGRMEIATKAIYACEIHHGGGDHWSGHEGVYTLKKFAESIEINYKTLSQWVSIKRNVFDKVGAKWSDKKFSAASRTNEAVDEDTPKEQVLKIYLRELARTPESSHLRAMNHNLERIVRHHRQGKELFKGISQEQLIESLSALDKVRKIVKERINEI